jgi:hypothetical protein
MYNFSSEFFNNNTIHDNENMSVGKIEGKVNGFQEANTTVKQKRDSINQVLPGHVQKS